MLPKLPRSTLHLPTIYLPTRYLIILALAFSACKRADKQEPAATETAGETDRGAPAATQAEPPAQAARAQATERPECPDDEALADMLRTALRLATKETDAKTIEVTGCTPGLFPAPGFYVRAWVDAMEDDEPVDSEYHHVIVDATTRQRVAMAKPAQVSPMDRMGEFGTADGEAVDLDGDGIDELLHTEDIDAKGTQQRTRVIMKVSGDALAELARFIESFSDSAAHGDEGGSECTAEITIAPPGNDGARSFTIEGRVTRAQDAPAENTQDCIQGRRVYRLAGGTLAETDEAGATGQAASP